MIRRASGLLLAARNLVDAEVQRAKWSHTLDRRSLEELDSVIRANLSIFLEHNNLGSHHGQVLPGDISLVVEIGESIFVSFGDRLLRTLTVPLDG